MNYKYDSAIIVIEDMINKKKEEVGDNYNPNKYVVIVPLFMYEVLLDKYKIEEIFYLYYNKVRILFSENSKVIMVDKDEYNKNYNPCKFIRVG